MIRRLVFIFLLSVVYQADAFLDPIEYANYIQNLNTQINTLRSAALALTMLQNQTKNLGHVSDYQWQDISETIDRMRASMQQGQGIATNFSKVDRDFRVRYPDYARDGALRDYSRAYQGWQSATLDTLRNSLSAAALDADHVADEEAALKRLQAQGHTASGRLQALQVISEVAGEHLNQLIQLRELTHAQMSAQNAYMAYRVSQDSYHQGQLALLVKHLETQFPDNVDQSGFGALTK